MSVSAADPSVTRLLTPDEPAPYKTLNATSEGGVLFVCDHAANQVPQKLSGLGIAPAELDRHIGWDIGAARVTEILAARFGAPAVLGNYSRLVIDLNRQLWDPTGIPERSDGTVIPGNLDLLPEARMARIRELFLPYHWAIEEQIAQFHSRGTAPAIVAVHSFTPVFDGTLRPWHIGVLWDQEARIAKPMMTALAESGEWVIGDNEPYSGKHLADYTIDHHAEAAGLPCVSLEIRQDLISDELGIERMAKVIGDALAGILGNQSLYQVDRR